MLAAETQRVTAILKEAMEQRYGSDQIEYHCADTNDTLCYATNQNQNATHALLQSAADVALIVGGYNSSNGTLGRDMFACDAEFPIANSEELCSAERIRHFDIKERKVIESGDGYPTQRRYAWL